MAIFCQKKQLCNTAATIKVIILLELNLFWFIERKSIFEFLQFN